MKEIPLVYCFDEKYAKHTSVSMYSAFKNSTTPIVFYCVPNFKDTEPLQPITNLAHKFNLNVNFIDGTENSFSDWKVSHHITKAAYLRFLIPDMLPYDKAIYLDCDTVVLGDLTELYDTDLGDNVIAGIGEKMKSEQSPVSSSIKDTYYNSGCLLMDLKKMREMNFLQLCADFHNNCPNEIKWHDQDIINKVLEGNKKDLSSEWNFQLLHALSDEEWKEFYKAKILHYNGPTKPWEPHFQIKLGYIWWQYWHDMTKEIYFS